MMQIPWAKPYVGNEEIERINKVMTSGWLTGGPEVAELESRLGEITQSRHCIAVNSGTAALDMALKVLGVGPGDEVIIPALSYIATGNAVLYQHATPVFADIDPSSYTIDPSKVAALITDRTKAVIAIDYAGHPADYDGLAKVLSARGIPLVEDGAPGIGGAYRGRPLCARGDISTTSFHMAKTFTTIEGGMVFTDRDDWARELRVFRSQGENPDVKYDHPILGHNYRMSDLHAAIGNAQFGRFEAVMAKRREIADFYTKAFEEVPSITTPSIWPDSLHAYFLYPILVPRRDQVREALLKRGVSTNVSWPKPIYAQPAYKAFSAPECPVAEHAAQHLLCLPLYFEMSAEEQDYVARCVVEVVGV